MSFQITTPALGIKAPDIIIQTAREELARKLNRMESLRRELAIMRKGLEDVQTRLSGLKRETDELRQWLKEADQD